MGKYITRRILVTIPVLLGVILLIFFMLNVLPGDPATVMMKEKLNEDVVEDLRASMRLDDPFFVRYLNYIRGALHGDLGKSWKLNRPVAELIADAFPYTLNLGVAAALFSWITGIPVGLIAALKRRKLADRIGMGFSLLGVSMPAFWIALILQNTFKSVLPVSGADSWQCYVLPTVVLGWPSAARIARLTRSSLLDVLRADHVRTAHAKGLTALRVVNAHALRNALIPVVTMMIIQFATLLSGAVVTETVFSIPGIGRLAVTAIKNRDMPLLQGTAIFTAVLIVAGNLIADLLYSAIDPRIRVE